MCCWFFFEHALYVREDCYKEKTTSQAETEIAQWLRPQNNLLERNTIKMALDFRNYPENKTKEIFESHEKSLFCLIK